MVEPVAAAEAPAQTQPAPAPQTVEVPVIVHQVQNDRVKIGRDGSVEVYGNATVEIEDEGAEAETRPSVDRTDGARATGAGMAVVGQTAKLDGEGKPSAVSFDSTGADGVSGGGSKGQAGGSSTSASAKGADPNALFLYGFGAVLIVAGIIAGVKFQDYVMGICLFLAGGVIIACGSMVTDCPELLYAVVGASVLLLVGFLLYKSGAFNNVRGALGAVVKGVDELYTEDKEAGERVKAKVEKAAGPRLPAVQNTIRGVKANIAKAKAKADAGAV